MNVLPFSGNDTSMYSFCIYNTPCLNILHFYNGLNNIIISSGNDNIIHINVADENNIIIYNYYDHIIFV